MADEKPRRRRGAPSRWDDPKWVEYTIKQARKAVLLGATDADLADLFGVHPSTLADWKVSHPKFGETVNRARDEKDAQVERSLYERAMGYSHKAVKIFCSKDGVVTKVPYEERYPPDSTALIFWLKNRQPARWRDVRHMEVKDERQPRELTREELLEIAAANRRPDQPSPKTH